MAMATRTAAIMATATTTVIPMAITAIKTAGYQNGNGYTNGGDYTNGNGYTNGGHDGPGDTSNSVDEAPAADPADPTDELPNSVALVWYLDGVRRTDKGTFSTSEDWNWLPGDIIPMELHFDEVTATDMGVWTLRAYSYGEWVESLYALFLQVGEFEPLEEILPLNAVTVATESALRDAIDLATAPLTITLTADITLNNGVLSLPDGANITLTGAHRLIANGDFAAIWVNEGTSLTLDGITVTRTPSTSQRGIWTAVNSNLTMLSGEISGHSTTLNGGGVANNGNFTMSGGTITGNTTTGNAGGVGNWGTFTMSGGTISNNTGNFGGGIGTWGPTLTISATLTISGGTISGNRARDNGGGVHSFNSNFTMTAGTISNNTAVWNGGGVNNGGATSIFTMEGGTISNNEADGRGGGVINWTTFIMNGGTISGNTAEWAGGGVRNWEGTFTMNGGTISDNLVNDGYGGGVSNWEGTFTMRNGTISGNTADFGGGVYSAVGIIAHDATFTMEGGEIRNNIARAHGGGVYIGHYSDFVMSGGTISSNSASDLGDAVFAGISSNVNYTGGFIDGGVIGFTNEVFTFTAVQVGGVDGITDTTGIRLTFTPPVISLRPQIIHISPMGASGGAIPGVGATIESVTDEGDGVWLVEIDNITVNNGESIIIGVGQWPGFEPRPTGSPANVQVFRDIGPPIVENAVPYGLIVPIDFGELVLTFSQDMNPALGVVTLNGTPLTGSGWLSNRELTSYLPRLIYALDYSVHISGFESTSGVTMAPHTHIFTAVHSDPRTIIFNAGSGTVSPTYGTTEGTGRLASLPTPTRPNYTFDGWFTEEIGGIEVTGGPFTGTIFSADTTIFARWTPLTIYTITASGGSGGSILPSGNVSVNEGANQSFLIVPDPGFIVYSLEVDGVNSGSLLSYTFNNVTQNHSIHAMFEPASYTVTFSPASAAITNANLSQTITVEGTATSNISIGYNSAQVPDGVTIAYDAVAGTVTITGVRPTAQGAAAITGNFNISVTRGGVAQSFSVSVNLTTTWTAPGGTGNGGNGGNVSYQGNQDTHAQSPWISQHPQNVTVYVGEDATLSVTVGNVTDGGALSFQWYRATGASGGSFVRIPRATERTFNPGTGSAGVNRYRVVVTNTNNSPRISGDRVVRAFSQTATVTVTAETSAPLPLLRLDVGSYTFTHNGNTRQSDATPFIDPAYDRLMVPLRLIAEAMGADVAWQHDTRSVIISSGATQVSLTIGVALPNGMGVPVIVNDRTFVPIRYVTEILGGDVTWDDANRAVYVFGQVNLPSNSPSDAVAYIDRRAIEEIELALMANNEDDEPKPDYEARRAARLAWLLSREAPNMFEPEEI